MVKLWCAAIADGSVFPIEIEPTARVQDLQHAIFKLKEYGQHYQFVASELTLYFAKRNGQWLSSSDTDVELLKQGKVSEGISNMLNDIMLIMDAAATIEKVLLPFPSKEELHVLVQLPIKARFVWREPTALVRDSSNGAKWDFQHSLHLENLMSEIRCHYHAWRRGNIDKQSHPLFMYVDGPGTGKSRFLDEFPTLIKQQMACEDDVEMKQLVQCAYTFKLTFGHETCDNHRSFAYPTALIGTRMLYQLQSSMSWKTFCENEMYHMNPEEVFTHLSYITRKPLNKMCVILCVDNLDKLEAGGRGSSFHSVFTTLCLLLNASKCFVIVIGSASMYQPVNDSVVFTCQKTFFLPTTSLACPTVNGRSLLEPLRGDNESLVQLLVDDMGGHARALEVLFSVMVQHQGKAFEYMPMMHHVLAAIRHAFPKVIKHMMDMKQAFYAVITRQIVDEYSSFGSLKLDQVISCGLIRCKQVYLECPFVLYLLLKSRLVDEPVQDFKDLKPWQAWEQFNSRFRALKSNFFSQQSSVLWTEIHIGARFGEGCDRRVIERPLICVPTTKQMSTKSKGFRKGTCSCGKDDGQCVVYQPIKGCLCGDASVCLEDSTNGFFHEIHHCSDDVSLDVVKRAKRRAAGCDDLFVFYCTSRVTGDVSTLSNVAVVDATCWNKYYGPFADRARFIHSVAWPCINTCPMAQLECVHGVDAHYRAQIIHKRPFSSVEDAQTRTDIPSTILKRFKFTVQTP
jgi:Crinkler effector protein N-terminal domain